MAPRKTDSNIQLTQESAQKSSAQQYGDEDESDSQFQNKKDFLFDTESEMQHSSFSPNISTASMSSEQPKSVSECSKAPEIGSKRKRVFTKDSDESVSQAFIKKNQFNWI